jgi:RHS repeat-associated protein
MIQSICFDYSGNFLYENGELKAIFTSAGRIIPFDNNGNIVYKFEYNLQDHLGNSRVVFSGHSNGQPEVMQVTDYYPFGMVMNQENYFASGVLSNKYLYNNKELQDDELAGNSLGWYDYGWRMYDPALARWHVQDPKAEKYYGTSPYTYAINNPMLIVDPNGDTISYSSALEKDPYAMKVVNHWLNNTKSGETYSSYYSEEGKYGHISVKIGYVNELPGYSEAKDITASGKSEVYLDNNKLKDNKNYGNYGFETATGSGCGKLEFYIGLSLGKESQDIIKFADDVNTVIHESQHGMIDHFDLLEKNTNRSSSQHHYLMGGVINNSLYRYRYNSYYNIIQQSWKKQSTNETIEKYIHNRINDGTGYQ